MSMVWVLGTAFCVSSFVCHFCCFRYLHDSNESKYVNKKLIAWNCIFSYELLHICALIKNDILLSIRQLIEAVRMKKQMIKTLAVMSIQLWCLVCPLSVSMMLTCDNTVNWNEDQTRRPLCNFWRLSLYSWWIGASLRRVYILKTS